MKNHISAKLSDYERAHMEAVQGLTGLNTSDIIRLSLWNFINDFKRQPDPTLDLDATDSLDLLHDRKKALLKREAEGEDVSGDLYTIDRLYNSLLRTEMSRRKFYSDVVTKDQLNSVLTEMLSIVNESVSSPTEVKKVLEKFKGLI